MAEPDFRAPFKDCDSFVAADSSLVTRCMAGTIAALLVGAVAWTAWASVEEIVRAAGRAEPSGQVKLVNHPHGGKVTSVLVREGDQVDAGAVLLQLDGTVAARERDELVGRLLARQAEAARLDSEAHDLPMRVPPDLVAARPDLVEAQLQLKEARAAALASRRAALSETIEGRRAAAATAATERNRAQEALGHLDQQLTAVRELAARGLYPKLRLAAAEKQRADARAERQKAETEIASAQAALAEARSRRQSLERDWRSEVLTELSRANAERDRLAEQLAAQDAILDTLEVRAPAGGIVLDLKIAAAGQSVAPHDTIMKLVPVGEALTFEARVRNEDIGRVTLQMPATVKVRALDFLRYGALEGEVTRIAADATPEPERRELSYVVTVTTDRQYLEGEAGARFIVPGMLVDVELKAGERTILSYLTDRLWRWHDGAFKDG